MIEVLLPGIWYGKVNQMSLDELKGSLLSVQEERERILLIVEIMKKGDFSVKNLLVDLMNQTKDKTVLNLCIRLFCSVCTHDDLQNIGNLRFLDSASSFGAFTFVVGATATMSYQVIPYLLALWGQWDGFDSNLEIAIKDALDIFLNYRSTLSENATLDDVGNLYLDKIKTIDSDCYYYKVSPAFPGLLTQEIMTALYIAAQKREKYNLYVQFSLLSIFTGEKIPVDTDAVISRNELDLMIGYIDRLAEKNWIEGMKYFYGHPVENL